MSEYNDSVDEDAAYDEYRASWRGRLARTCEYLWRCFSPANLWSWCRYPSVTVWGCENVVLDAPNYHHIRVRGGTANIKCPGTIRHLSVYRGTVLFYTGWIRTMTYPSERPANNSP